MDKTVIVKLDPCADVKLSGKPNPFCTHSWHNKTCVGCPFEAIREAKRKKKAGR